MDYRYLQVEAKDHIAIVTINKEKSLNALNTELIKELRDCFLSLEKDEDTFSIIITGKSKAFVAGADISEMVNLTSEEAFEFSKFGNETFLIIESINKPVIAAVNGFALGGGCELALACDIRIASYKAKFGQPEVGLGITPGFGGTQRLAREIGQARAKELIYTGKVISAEEAYKIGLVNKLVDPDELMNEAIEMAEAINKNSKVAVAYSKRAIREGLQTSIEEGVKIEEESFKECFNAQDQKIGMEAFLERRKPNFK
ncbi:enoyl-CoA hydratase-related protein [Peptoniphilus catoniae]|uniref:enoyl-CoA hydratase-related protein n=1 Tax=Peptoniphilus catoniae TaxID=1660341 RepID=UPI0010FCED28|nr:enoyl-CoA hydratase-related protein [Peptoniphilus catoniae]